MPYVSRNDSNAINGMYANLQPGYAEEFLPDDDPEVVAFLDQPPPQPPRDPNSRLDDGVTAAQEVMSQPPSDFAPPLASGRAVGQEQFDALAAQVNQLQAAVKAMLEAHAQVQPGPG
jgi:hypothetical protein